MIVTKGAKSKSDFIVHKKDLLYFFNKFVKTFPKALCYEKLIKMFVYTVTKVV
jgi:hypothetical protein